MSCNRRTFSIGVGAAATISLNQMLTLWPAHCHAAVIHELGVGPSAAYAEQCARRGARVFSTVEDIGTLWHGTLRRHIAAGASLSGLTRHATTFLIATLASDAGFRVTGGDAKPVAHLTAWRVERA